MPWTAPADVPSREPPLREAIKAMDLDFFEEGQLSSGRARSFAETCLEERTESIRTIT